LNGEQANCDADKPYDTTTKGAYLERTTEVGSYEKVAPHPWNLCDMSGNVEQWCENKYDDKSNRRVLRGCSWFSHAEYCRSAFRSDGEPDIPVFNDGLRVVLVSP
jgi:formylglycine-generating enzyme